MINQPFNNDTDQQTRRQILRDPYLGRAQAEADMIGGRFKKQTEARVTGVPQYPRQPTSSPWASDPVPPEEPLGIDIEFVGELGGASPAQASTPCAVETIGSPERGGSPTALTDPPPFSRRRF
jgi:hypothetical protein